MVLYLLDAGVLLAANRLYYPKDRLPQFWTWLLDLAEMGRIKLPGEIFDKVMAGDEDLADWAGQHFLTLRLDEYVDGTIADRIVNEGYAPDLSLSELESIGLDPFMVAYASISPETRTVVTTEESAPSKRRANKRLPDVCRQFNIQCISTFELMSALDFHA